MTTTSAQPDRLHSLGVLGLKCLWQCIRVPLLALLLLLEPVVRTVLSSVALLALMMALILEFGASLPRFPFWGMLGLGGLCLALLIAYRALILVLTER